MIKLKTILTIFTLIGLVNNLNAKQQKVDEIKLAQELISQAYELGYVDAAPIEMSAIEKKVKDARAAREGRKKRLFKNLIEQIKVDLKIVKKRYEVNKLHNQLSQLQLENTSSEKALHDLKEQLK
jgi:hypothetical protein